MNVCELQICVSGKHVTQASLLEVLARKQIFLGSISSLNRVLHNIGFTFKTTDSRKRLMELGHIAISRVQFLRTYMQKILYSVHTLMRHGYLKMDPYTGLGRMIATKALKNGTLKVKGKLKYYFR
jgi:hypothetical protein